MSQDLRTALQASLGDTYRIERELGGGGMSRVFVAEDARLRRLVVIKVLSPDLTQGFSLQRFEREIQTAAGLQQANIVGVLSAGDADGLPYYIMPFVDGESLRAHVGRGPLPISDVVSIIRDVAKALTYAHRQGVVHRDIKPDNVLLSSGTAVVTDFGIAKAISAARTQSNDTGLTQAGMSIGTPAYMAPEQAAGDPNVDHRADLYSLGAMAFELLTGRQLFADRTPQRTLAAHLSEQPDDIARLRPDVPPAFGALVMRLLLKDPDARVQTAADVVQQLDAVTSAAQVASAPTATPQRSAMFGRALVIYIASFAAVMALTRVAVNMIGLPDWVLPGAFIVMALGLPIVLWTGYVQRVATATPTLTPGGTRTVPQGTLATLALRAAPQSSWSRTGRRGVFAVIAFMGLVAAAMSLRALGIGPEGSLIAANKLAANDRVVLADFSVHGADSTLGSALTTALRTQLEQSSVVQIVPQSSVEAALTRMRLPGGTSLTLPVARDVATREGAKAVIAADASPLGAGFLVTIRLVSSASGDVLASYAESAPTTEALLKSIDAAARKLRGRMGESLRAVRADAPLEQVTTSSLAALRKFVEAAHEGQTKGDYTRAVKLGEEAVALDSTFALAWRRLSLDYGNARMAASRAFFAAEQAYRYRDRLPPVERALVVGRYFGTGVHSNRAKAFESYAEALRLDSVTYNAASASNQLYGIAFGRRDFREAERYARIMIRVGPALNAGYASLANALLAQNRTREAKDAFDTLRSRFPGAPTLNTYANFFAVNRSYDSLETGLAGFRASANPVRRRSVWQISVVLSIVRGRLKSALADADSLDASVGAATRSDSAQALFERVYARLNLELEPTASLKILDQLSSSEYLAPIPVGLRRYYSHVQAYARAGEIAKAKALMARGDAALTDEESRYLTQTARHNALAELALAEGRFAEALAEFRAADRLPDGPSGSCAVCLPGSLARVFDKAGQSDSAIAAFTAYHGRAEGLVSLNFDAANLAGSYKRLGELYEAKGDTRRAVESYDKFVALWKNADPELQPIVRDVRGRITRLTPVEPRR